MRELNKDGSCKHCGARWMFHQKLFKKEVSDRAKEVDPQDEYDWFDLTVGWAIGRHLEPEEAHEFARHIRYHTNL